LPHASASVRACHPVMSTDLLRVSTGRHLPGPRTLRKGSSVVLDDVVDGAARRGGQLLSRMAEPQTDLREARARQQLANART
jgi:hypothetical protein